MKRVLRLVVVLVVVASLGAGARFLVKRKKGALAKAPRYGLRPTPVQVATTRLGNVPVKVDYLSVVEPIRVANLSARVTATVEKVLFDEGDRVEAEQVVIVLDGREIRDDIAAVESQIAQAQADLAANEATVKSLVDSVAYWRREAQRDQTLAEKGDIPGAQAEGTADKANEFEGRLEAGKKKSDAFGHLIRSLEKKKAQLATKLSYCTITSPYDGVVTHREVDPGDLASPGKRLMIVEDRSRLKLAFDVPQQDLPRVRQGLAVTFAAGGETRQAKVSLMFPSLNAARMLRAEVFLSGRQMQGLSCGQYVPASVILEQIKGVTLLPASCLIECPKHRQHVFVVRDGKLVHQQVKVLAHSGDLMAVEGVKPGEQVVTNTFLGWARLSAGKKVEVLQ